jgi:hypothetical protein
VVISGAYSLTLSGSAIVRNDIFATDIRTGESVLGSLLTLRLSQESAEGFDRKWTNRQWRCYACHSISESSGYFYSLFAFSCYLAIAFRNEPLELWHLKSFRLLRRMSKACPVIIDMVSRLEIDVLI